MSAGVGGMSSHGVKAVRRFLEAPSMLLWLLSSRFSQPLALPVVNGMHGEGNCPGNSDHKRAGGTCRQLWADRAVLWIV